MKYLVALVYILCILHSVSAANDIIIKNLKMFVNCEEFFIKAMCYSPAPRGYQNGGGFCSLKETAYGDYKSACYDSDFFDGSLDNPLREPAGPTKGWFSPLWERDFPAMKELGVNTVRLYNANPTTRQSTVRDLGTNGIVEPYGKDHTQFMTLAAQYDLKVIFPLVADYNILVNNPDSVIEQFLMNQIDEVGNFSNLLMWNFGNELPLTDDLITRMNGLMDFIRNYTYTKWNRIVPVTVAVVDDPHTYDHLVATMKVDVFSTNAGYRGLNFQDLWSGAATPGFSGMNNLTQTYNKPVFISEIGWHNFNNTINTAIPDWFNQIYSDLIAHYDQGTLGGAFFEWSDEPAKDDVLQKTMGAVSYDIATNAQGSSIDANVWLADILVPKPILYDAIRNGTFNGIAYNWNANPFDLVGRAPYTLSANECVVTPPESTTTTGVVATTTGTSTTAAVETTTTGAASTTSATTNGATAATTGTPSTTSSAETSASATSASTTGTPATTSSSATGVSATTAQAPGTGTTTGSNPIENQESSAAKLPIVYALMSVLILFYIL